jgi:hypothetical protein
MERMIRTYFDGCNEADVEKIVACFTPEAVHYFPPGMYEGPFRAFRGARKIAEKWQAAVRNLGSYWTVDRLLVEPIRYEAVMEWSLFKTKRGTILRGIEWYEFDEPSGLIREIRARPEGPGAPWSSATSTMLPAATRQHHLRASAEPHLLENAMPEYRRVFIDGVAGTVAVEDGGFVWTDGHLDSVDEAIHLPPVQPSKIVCVHLNYRSRLDELKRKQPPAPRLLHEAAVLPQRPSRQGDPAERLSVPQL